MRGNPLVSRKILLPLLSVVLTGLACGPVGLPGATPPVAPEAIATLVAATLTALAPPGGGRPPRPGRPGCWGGRARRCRSLTPEACRASSSPLMVSGSPICDAVLRRDRRNCVLSTGTGGAPR